MTSTLRRFSGRVVIAASALALTVAPLSVMSPAGASVDGTGVVINETYLSGGSAGAAYVNKFIELYNPGESAVSLAGWSIQYRSGSGTGNFGTFPLSGSIASHGHYLIQGGTNGAAGAALPTPDATTGINPSGTVGTILLSNQASALNPGTGSITGNPAVVDLVGYGGTGAPAPTNTFETAQAAGPTSNTDVRSNNRTAFADTDNNSADFSLSATITPQNSGPVEPPGDPVPATIAEIQGTGAVSPFEGDPVITEGVVTAAYMTGNFSGFYIQTEGTGGDIDLDTHHASDGIFVFGSAFVPLVEIGDLVEVTGNVSEFGTMTELTPLADGLEILGDPTEPVTAAELAYPATDANRETLEGMLIDPQGDYIVADNFDLNAFGVVGLAAGTTPLRQPTDVAPPLETGGDNSAYNAVVADNLARGVFLDDGSSLNFLSQANKSIPLPYLTVADPIRVGADVTFNQPVIFDYRNSGWNFQPTQQLTAANAAAVQPATFENTREAHPQDVGGDVQLASFNVLNYFTETGVDWVADGGTCSYFTDRDTNPITTNTCSDPGPRGAANDVNLQRQQDKLVKAINALNADVVSLEEIENSSNYSVDRDEALSTLTDALNADAGTDKWAFAPTPPDAGDQTEQDVIRTAFIYQPDVVETVGDSVIFDDPAFDNARDPLAQAFQLTDGDVDSRFVAIVNHFKSKSSGTGVDADQGDGQGASNFSRTVQAEALADFAADFSSDPDINTDRVFLMGDFNSYTEEDPLQLLYNTGYKNIGKELTDESTYLFDGVVGSLDHVLASPTAFADVTGADVWNINSVESVALEYSRYNYNATNFYQVDPFRSSDHDPLIVGVDLVDEVEPVDSTTTATVNPITYGQAGTVHVTVTSDPQATGQVEVLEGATSLGTASLSGGTADVVLGATALAPGSHTLTVNYAGSAAVNPSSTTVNVTVSKNNSTTTATSPGVSYGTAPTVNVTVTANPTPTGTVEVRRNGVLLGTGTLSGGTASVALPRLTLRPGSHSLTVNYLGSAFSNPSSTTTTLQVAKATPTMATSVAPGRIVVNQTRARVTVTMTSPAVVPTGAIKIRSGGALIGEGTLMNGQVVVTLNTFRSVGTKQVKVRYNGDANHVAVVNTIQITVVRP